MVFCNNYWRIKDRYEDYVTILILVDGFLQYSLDIDLIKSMLSHNPYFSRWFSAIKVLKMEKQQFIKSQSLF